MWVSQQPVIKSAGVLYWVQWHHTKPPGSPNSWAVLGGTGAGVWAEGLAAPVFRGQTPMEAILGAGIASRILAAGVKMPFALPRSNQRRSAVAGGGRAKK